MISERISNLLATFIEITLPNEENFLLIRETLSRIGIPSNKEKKLFQSCHILHKQGHYYIVHFKELFSLDGKISSIDDNDISRRNSIAKLLFDWKLCSIVGATETSWPSTMMTFIPISKLTILPYKDKKNWQLVSKYSIGKKRV